MSLIEDASDVIGRTKLPSTSFEEWMGLAIDVQNKRVGGANIRERFRPPSDAPSPNLVLSRNDYLGYGAVRRKILGGLLLSDEVKPDLQSPLFQVAGQGSKEWAEFMGFEEAIPCNSSTDINRYLVEIFEWLSQRRAVYLAPSAVHRSFHFPIQYAHLQQAECEDFTLPERVQATRMSLVNSHFDFGLLQSQVEALSTSKYKVLILEGIYSGTGETYLPQNIADLKKLLIFAKQKGFFVVVDISHDGLLQYTNLFKEHNLTEYVDAASMSGSKAKGGGPAYVFLNNSKIAEFFHRYDSVIFSSGIEHEQRMTDALLLKEHLLTGRQRALDCIESVNYLNTRLVEAGFTTAWTAPSGQLVPSGSTFLPVSAADEVCFSLKDYLAYMGVAAAVFLRPAVGAMGGLRLSGHPNLEKKVIDELVERQLPEAMTQLRASLEQLLATAPGDRYRILDSAFERKLRAA